MNEHRHFVHSDFPHLSSDEWDAVQRMVESVGTDIVGAMLTTLDVTTQRASIFAFVQREVTAVHQQNNLLMQQIQQRQDVVVERTQRPEFLKLEVTKYRGSESESLLRWLVELEAAILARGIKDPLMQVAFAMSNLAGRAKTWAFGKRLSDHTCFNTYEIFRDELRQAFEPPKSEFRARSEFLDLKQGKRDIHAYTQNARYLVSCIVNNPVDDQTQVVTFMKGLNDGPIKTHLFRVYPETLEEAISLSIQEDFSLNQAKVHSVGYRAPRAHNSTEAMDLSVARTNQRGNTSFDKRSQRCHRCGQNGHYARECRVRTVYSPRVNRPVDARSSQHGSGRFASRNRERDTYSSRLNEKRQ